MRLRTLHLPTDLPYQQYFLLHSLLLAIFVHIAMLGILHLLQACHIFVCESGLRDIVVLRGVFYRVFFSLFSCFALVRKKFSI